MKTRIVNRTTGEIKEIAMSTPKQIEYLRRLEHQLGMVVHNHTDKTVWKAMKRIEKLQAKLRNKQPTLFD